MATDMILTALLVLITSQLGGSDVPDDEVTSLPGLSWKPNFRQYSGFLKATGTKQLHYWFVESQGNPDKDPLVLWLNGGPGCSSLLGFLGEHGPFLIDNDGKTLLKNDFSWNTVANMLYLEAPAGVGYSYSSDRNYSTSDDETSLDNYFALKNFMHSFPEFSKNDFYITGESYAGVYVPTLAIRVSKDETFNFMGFAVGNGIGDLQMLHDSLIYYVYYHGLIDDELWTALVHSCCTGANSTIGNCNFYGDACSKMLPEIDKILSYLDIYNLYDDCTLGTACSNRKATLHPHELFMYDSKSRNERTVTKLKSPSSQFFCINETAMSRYLSDGEVRKALHIPGFLPKWESCSTLNYTWQYKTMKSQYLDILSLQKPRILMFNGDVDMCCNYLGDQWFVNSLQLKTTVERTPWFHTDPNGSKQVAGFMKKFSNLTFAILKGAGHMVPHDKPAQALEMFANFLSGVF